MLCGGVSRELRGGEHRVGEYWGEKRERECVRVTCEGGWVGLCAGRGSDASVEEGNKRDRAEGRELLRSEV